MTRQEIFDLVVAGLAARDFVRAGVQYTDKFACKYRSPVGPCAVGLLVTDEEYSEEWEGGGVNGIAHKLPERLQEHLGFLQALQEAHDTSPTEAFMKKDLRRVAYIWGVKIPEALYD